MFWFIFLVLKEMVKNADEALAKWEEAERTKTPVEEGVKDAELEIVFKAGTSKRIWNELYKVYYTSSFFCNLSCCCSFIHVVWL